MLLSGTHRATVLRLLRGTCTKTTCYPDGQHPRGEWSIKRRTPGGETCARNGDGLRRVRKAHPGGVCRPETIFSGLDSPVTLGKVCSARCRTPQYRIFQQLRISRQRPIITHFTWREPAMRGNGWCVTDCPKSGGGLSWGNTECTSLLTVGEHMGMWEDSLCGFAPSDSSSPSPVISASSRHRSLLPRSSRTSRDTPVTTCVPSAPTP